MQRMQIIGIELSEGVSTKSGSAKPYSIGQIHTMIELAPARGADNISKGLIGSTYECDANILRAIKHLPFPLVAEVDVRPVHSFGKRKDVVYDVKPIETQKKAA
jgi:hypothetical protein